MYDNLTPDPNNPEELIKIDIANAFNTLCLFLTLNCVSGTVLCDYACGLKTVDRIESAYAPLRTMFSYLQSMRTCNSILRYYDWFDKVHIAQGKTGGQQGDPIEMLIFNLSIRHLWGRTLTQHPRARAVAYADDGYIKAPLSVGLHVFAALKDKFHE